MVCATSVVPAAVESVPGSASPVSSSLYKIGKKLYKCTMSCKLEMILAERFG